MIKSKERISKFGEVFTSEREVKAMLDLVKHETDRIDSRFLEPACGDGNFLYEVLKRKLQVVTERYRKSEIEFKRYIFIAVSSIYGIDILSDNVEACRKRLFNLVKEECKKIFKGSDENKFFDVIWFVLLRNILHGDALSLTTPESDLPIIFSEWSFTTGSKVKRTDYTLNNLLAYNKPFKETSLFSDSGEEALMPEPLRTYPLVHFMDIKDG